jgi:hypothetical protein
MLKSIPGAQKSNEQMLLFSILNNIEELLLLTFSMHFDWP